MTKQIGIKNPEANLKDYNIQNVKNAFWNFKPNLLIEETLKRNEGTLSQNGTLTIKTGKFTGRSPQDRFIVKDRMTENTVDWNPINKPFDADKFDALQTKMTQYFSGKDIFIKDAAICNDSAYQLKVRVIAENAFSVHFVHNMFIRLDDLEIETFTPEWLIIVAPGFKADPKVDGTRAENFSIINFEKKTIIIGGSGYTGEIKKGMFSVLNFNLPHHHQVLSMHCSANIGKDNDTAVFFGLSGTGKTTLSADPSRALIGDDEHGWSDEGLFNFEGGCYAKCINLTAESEPDIFNAIRPGAILENIQFYPGTSRPNYEDISITENTRVSYPIHHIENCYENNIAPTPKNVFFLTCDAFGILPPISKLTIEQAMYYFVSGYTAKVAGTEEGIEEPVATFSSCFGAPFIPLHPNEYALLLGEKIKQNDANIWLINTGWTGGQYGIGKRISLKHTRQLISSALNNQFDNVSFTNFDVFNLQIPSFCEGISGDILHPRNSWADKEEFDKKRIELAKLFNNNFKQFESKVSKSILNSAPNPKVEMAF